MKGEYTDDHYNSTTTMFSNLHQTQKFQPHRLQSTTQSPTFLTTGVHDSNFNLGVQTSEEPNSPTTALKTESSQNDGASIEVVRRPRGRPPGSKNKSKPPIIITRDTEPSMSPYVLEIPAGSDLINTVTIFCRRRNSGLCILNGTGTVANVTLKQPSTTPGATVTFHGRFDMLSISGTILPSLQHIGNNFTISLAGPQGQIVGGAVVAPLVAASTVYIIASSFNSPFFHRLPVEDEQGNNNDNGVADVADVASPSGGGDSGGHRVASDGGGMPIYSCNSLATDVIWAPTPRQPPSY